MKVFDFCDSVIEGKDCYLNPVAFDLFDKEGFYCKKTYIGPCRRSRKGEYELVLKKYKGNTVKIKKVALDHLGSGDVCGYTLHLFNLLMGTRDYVSVGSDLGIFKNLGRNKREYICGYMK